MEFQDEMGYYVTMDVAKIRIVCYLMINVERVYTCEKGKEKQLIDRTLCDEGVELYMVNFL